MTETKQFHIGDVLSITSDKLVSPEHIDGVYNILGWMVGEDLMTHQLSRVSRECEPFLREQHPELSAVDVPDTINSKESALAFFETLYPRFGQYVAVAKIADVDHTTIAPISEIKMIRPDLPIITLDGEAESYLAEIRGMRAGLPDRVAVAEVIDREHMRLHGSSSGDFGVYLRIADAVLALLGGEGQARKLSSGAPDFWCHTCNRGLEGCYHEPSREGQK